MARGWRAGVAALAVVAALGLHRHVCEWRGRSYALSEAVAVEARLLLSLQRRDVPAGNAPAWDAAAKMNGPRIRTWGRCFDQVHGAPDPEERAPREACLSASRFPVHDPPTRSVALGECEIARFGRVRHAEAMGACLRAAGHEPYATPRWTSDVLGPRYETAYRGRVGLWAETLDEADPDGDRRRALGLGVVAPALLLGAAGTLLLGRRRPAPRPR